MAPMMHAAMHGNTAIVKALLTHGKALVNPENDDGLSTLDVFLIPSVTLTLTLSSSPRGKSLWLLGCYHYAH